uniref:RNase H type-1 domain-containing protein n=1 Tax=Cajanus cajan TaxID=3821 RepID=A0A151S0J9_CAJCA|nr:hypothetical protein KK1_030008 [Cajanus cajan]
MHDIQSSHRLAAILYSIEELVHRPWTIQFEHSFREGNKCADLLARRGQMRGLEVEELVSPPPEVESQVLADIAGGPIVRL